MCLEKRQKLHCVEVKNSRKRKEMKKSKDTQTREKKNTMLERNERKRTEPTLRNGESKYSRKKKHHNVDTILLNGKKESDERNDTIKKVTHRGFAAKKVEQKKVVWKPKIEKKNL